MFFRFEMPLCLSIITAAVLIIGAMHIGRRKNVVVSPVIKDSMGNTVDAEEVVDKYNSLLTIKEELVEELYLVNMCSNCAYYDSVNERCKKHNTSEHPDTFCKDWNFDEEDMNKLLHNRIIEV